MVEPNFQGVNRPFVLAFENDAQRTSSKRYYLPNVGIRNYNVMINGENFFDQPVKDNKVAYEYIRKIAVGQGDDYTTGCLLDYQYFKDSKINFTSNLDRAGNTRIYFILEEAKKKKLNLIFHKEQ